MEFVAAVEIELTQQELEDLTKLSGLWEQDLPTTVRECLNTHCKDAITILSQEPDDEKNIN
jgi:hypothetical protein